MPRQDGTGPQGQGPATGWGRGPCGQGLRGRGGRYGRGRSFGWNMPITGRQISKDEELDLLKDEKEALKKEIEAIEKEIQDVKKAK